MMVHNREGTSTRPLRGFARTLGAGALATFAALAACAAESPPAPIPIVLADNATPAEANAASELAAYFGKMTGAKFEVLPEAKAGNPPSALYIGPTALAKANGVDVAAMGAEEWALKRVGESLIVAGGRPRGTIYAAYHLLEDHYGVRWWTPWEETVPKLAGIKLPSVDIRRKPAFACRDIYIIEGPGGRPGASPFCARNRLNRNGDGFIGHPQCGGQEDYGPPYPSHTLGLYVPTAEHYEKHPDWFALVGGKRQHGAHNTYNLCLTNPELRRFMLEKLKAYIEESHKRLAHIGTTRPVYNISYNEAPICECPNCKALETREGGGAGPLLDLVNDLADRVREQYPDVFIETLAYTHSQKPPKTLKARDNVIVRLCDDQSFISKPITDPGNTEFRETLLGWMSVCKNLCIWRYGISYGPYVGGGFMSAQVPFASAQNFGTDMRFYAEHNVTGVFVEHEGSIPGDMLDFKRWMNAKVMEDPSLDYAALLKDFTDGYYGAAGPFIREYLKALQAAQEAGTPITTFTATLQLTHFDVPFLMKAHALFDRAEKAVQADSVLLRRTRYARLSLDRTTLGLFNRLAHDWEGSGPMPLDQNAIAARAKETWLTMIGLRMKPEQQQQEQANAEAEIDRILKPRDEVELPEQFRSLPKGSVWDYTPEDFDDTWSFIRPQPDPEADLGMTARVELTQRLPVTWRLYDLRTPCEPYATKPEDLKAIKVSAGIRSEDIPGPGYHWFKLPTAALGDGGYYVLVMGIKCNFSVPKKGPYDIWARITFEGPDFPHGKEGQINAICVERIVVAKSAAGR